MEKLNAALLFEPIQPTVENLVYNSSKWCPPNHWTTSKGYKRESKNWKCQWWWTAAGIHQILLII